MLTIALTIRIEIIERVLETATSSSGQRHLDLVVASDTHQRGGLLITEAMLFVVEELAVKIAEILTV